MATTDRGKLTKKRFSISAVSTPAVTGNDGPGGPRPMLRFENTFQMTPRKRFPVEQVREIVNETLSSQLADQTYDPNACATKTKTISELIKSRVNDLVINRYKIVCSVTIGMKSTHDVMVSSRCLWDMQNDNFASGDFCNAHLFAVATVYGAYYE